MAWTASLGVSVGDATKETDYDQLVANAEYLHTALNTIMDTDVGGALSAGIGGVSVGDDMTWTDYVETAPDENAQKVIIVDLDDPGTIWDYAQFMQQIQGTSWHNELGDPPIHGLMYINEAQDKVVWWNRETGAAYMEFDVGADNFLRSGAPADVAFLDGIIYIAVDEGEILLVDLLRDTAYRHDTSGQSYNADDVAGRNSGGGGGNMLNSSLAIINDVVNAAGAARDPELTDEFGRPKHWWAAGTDGGGSVYNPADDAIYDSSTTNDFEQLNLTATGVLSYSRDNGTRQKWGVIRSIFGIEADAWSADTLWANDRADAEDIAWTDAATTTPYALLDGRSWAEEGMPQVWFGSDEGAYVGHVHSSTNATEGGLIRLTETYASPYMKGDIRGAWPLHSIADVAPGGHTLTNNNTVTFSNGGPAGSYANFDGVNQTLSLADHADMDGMSKLTVAAWIYRDTDSGGAEGLVSKHDTNDGANSSFMLYVNTDDKPYFLTGTSGIVQNIGPTIKLAMWYYLVGTYDGATSKLYVNGMLTDSDAQTGSIIDSDEGFRIGSWESSGGAAAFFDGRIGGVSVSASAMTEREIKAEYARGLRRINSTIDTNDTISDNDVAAIAADPNGKYVAVMGDDKVVNVFDEFAVPVASDTYPGTTARVPAIKSMLNGPDPHYVMAGSDQIELVQPNTTIGV